MLNNNSQGLSTPDSSTRHRPAVEEIAPQLMAHVQGYQYPVLRLSIQQICTSLLPLIALLGLMCWTYQHSYLLTFLLSIPASVFVIRVFIVQHDCGHGSFFKSRRANNAVGWLCSMFTFFPYEYWKHQHAMHHANNGKLEGRGDGDVFLVTVKEYMALSSWERLKYLMIRNPITLFIFGPFVLFFIMNRFAYDSERTPRDVRIGLYISNVLTVITFGLVVYTLGWKMAAGVFLPVIFFSGLFGTILFYVQHQFEETYFESSDEWNYFRAAIFGSSFFDLPRFLHWCSGNIGYHHVHHLAPKIPNYHLAECHYSHPAFDLVKRETVRSFLKTFSLAFWDEDKKRLISFGEMKRTYLSPRIQEQHLAPPLEEVSFDSRVN